MTETTSWILAGVVVLVLIAWYLTYTAARLDRLHVRVTGTLAALDAQLVRRSDAALELANSGLLDGASSMLLAGAAALALENPDEHGEAREAAESDLTEALHLALSHEAVAQARESGPFGEDLLHRVHSAGTRVGLARRFHNDAVTDVRRVRRKLVVRAFHLAGHTDLPVTVEFDDALPAGLAP